MKQTYAQQGKCVRSRLLSGRMPVSHAEGPLPSTANAYYRPFSDIQRSELIAAKQPLALDIARTAQGRPTRARHECGQPPHILQQHHNQARIAVAPERLLPPRLVRRRCIAPGRWPTPAGGCSDIVAPARCSRRRRSVLIWALQRPHMLLLKWSASTTAGKRHEPTQRPSTFIDSRRAKPAFPHRRSGRIPVSI